MCTDTFMRFRGRGIGDVAGYSWKNQGWGATKFRFTSITVRGGYTEDGCPTDNARVELLHVLYSQRRPGSIFSTHVSPGRRTNTIRRVRSVILSNAQRSDS